MELKTCLSCKRKLNHLNYRKERSICNFCWSRGIKNENEKVITKKDKKYTQELDTDLEKYIPKQTRLKETKVASLPGIYKLTNTKLNKVYIGQSGNLFSRSNNYKNLTGYINPVLKSDLSTMKPRYFRFEVLEYMPNSTTDERLDREAYYKSLFNPSDLYNLIQGREDAEGYEKYKEAQKELSIDTKL